MKTFIMRNWWKGVLALLLGQNPAEAQLLTNHPFNILFIGNSYTHMNEMPFIFNKIAKAKGKQVYVEMNTRSGASFQVHTTRTDMFEAIKSRKWDYVVIQGYSRELTYDSTYLDTATVPYVQLILDSIYQNNPCTNVLLHLTWGYKYGYLERPETDSYDKMTDKIIAGYTYLSQRFGLPIVPVGMVWREVQRRHPEIEMYDADQAHPSKNGSYASASTFYAAIFKESPEGAYTSTVNATFGKSIQKAAADMVLSNYIQLGLDKNQFTMVPLRTVEGKFILECFSNYPNATGWQWDFGDGKKSTDKSPTHVYKNAGIYNVSLTVEDTCGMRTYNQVVEYREIAKPLKKPKTPVKKGNTPRKKI